MTTTTSYGTWCNRVAPYSLTVEQTVEEYFGAEGTDGFDFDAIVRDYRDAINEALPDSVTLSGNDFYGPYYDDDCDFGGYPIDEDGRLDIRAIVDDIDLTPLVDKHAMWTIDDVAQYLGYTGSSATGSARKTLSRWGITAVSREPGRAGRSLYRAEDVRTAKENRPGQGTRTDLSNNAS